MEKIKKFFFAVAVPRETISNLSYEGALILIVLSVFLSIFFLVVMEMVVPGPVSYLCLFISVYFIHQTRIVWITRFRHPKGKTT